MDFPKHSLRLMIDESENFSQIEVVNTACTKNRNSLLRKLFFALILQLSYFLTFTEQHLFVHSFFLVVFIYNLKRLLGLVDCELLKIVSDFGIEKSTVFAFGRKQRLFVPINNVLKVVINEVIYLDRGVIYVLQVLTDGDFFKESPIIVLFDTLLPPLACLEIVYKKIHSNFLQDR